MKWEKGRDGGVRRAAGRAAGEPRPALACLDFCTGALTLTLACTEADECGDDASCTTTDTMTDSSTGPGTTTVSGSESMTSTSGSGETSTGGGSSSGDTSGGSGSSGGSDSGTGSGSEDSSGGGGSSTTGAFGCKGLPIVDLDSAVAITYGDLPPIKGGGMSTSGGGDGGGVPDDTLSLRLSNSPLTCEAPRYDTSCGPQLKWSVTIGIPVEFQEPGEYSLGDLNLGYSFVGAGVGEDCPGGGGGGFSDGTLIIESIGAAGLVGCIVDSSIPDLDANGTFTAEHCSAS